jgi:hypothetical protein
MTSYYHDETAGGLSGADIAGIVVGVSIGLPLLVVLCWGIAHCYHTRCTARGRKKHQESTAESAARVQRDFPAVPPGQEPTQTDDEGGVEIPEIKPVKVTVV